MLLDQLGQVAELADNIGVPQEYVAIEEPLSGSHVDLQLNLLEILQQRLSILCEVAKNVWSRELKELFDALK